MTEYSDRKTLITPYPRSLNETRSIVEGGYTEEYVITDVARACPDCEVTLRDGACPECGEVPNRRQWQETLRRRDPGDDPWASDRDEDSSVTVYRDRQTFVCACCSFEEVGGHYQTDDLETMRDHLQRHDQVPDRVLEALDRCGD